MPCLLKVSSLSTIYYVSYILFSKVVFEIHNFEVLYTCAKRFAKSIYIVSFFVICGLAAFFLQVFFFLGYSFFLQYRRTVAYYFEVYSL